MALYRGLTAKTGGTGDRLPALPEAVVPSPGLIAVGP